jgi:hypothetical protein
MRIAAVALVFALLGAASAQAADGWLTFHDPAAAFVFDTPRAPEAGQDATQGPDGKPVPILTYTVDLGNAAYLVEVSDLSAYNANADQFLDAAATGAESVGAKTISATAVQLDGQNGRQVVIDDKDGNRIIDRIYFVKGHIYQVMSVVPPDATSAQVGDGQRFLDSFHFAGG